MSKKKVYISGKITGIEKESIPLFAKGCREVKKMGFEPVNPRDVKLDNTATWAHYMKADIKLLMDCDAIYMLDNWEDSQGAKIELELAERVEISVMYQSNHG